MTHRVRPLAGLFLAVASSLAGAATHTVTTVADGGPGSLRAAIAAANLPGPTADTIVFDIPGAGPHRIVLASGLPAILGPTVIDGYSQPGSQANTLAVGSNAAIRVEIDGSALALDDSSPGLVLRAAVTVRGLSITGFSTGSGTTSAIELDADARPVVEGCWLGIRPTGAAAPNSRGITVRASQVQPFRIGGPTPNARNVIAANTSGQIILAQGTAGSGSGGLVEGNYIGTQPAGTQAPAPSGQRPPGIVVLRPGVLVRGNLIAGNGAGLEIGVGPATVVRNRIGLRADADQALANAIGVSIGGTAAVGIVLGGPSNANVIGFNTGAGVHVFNDSTRAAVLGDRVFGNGALGIDLAPDGVTPNDPVDADAGPNGLQNHPVLRSARRAFGDTVVTLAGNLSSTPATRFRLHFAADDTPEPGGHGEGRFPASTAIEVTTDAAGEATFGPVGLEFPGVPAIANVSATATALDAAGLPVATSEFGPAIAITLDAPGVFTVTTANATGPGSLRDAITAANAVANQAGVPDRIAFDIPGPGPHVIDVAAALPVVTDPVVIDGYTQPGAIPHVDGAHPGSQALLGVFLDGGVGAPALVVATSNSTLRGVAFTRNAAGAVRLGTQAAHEGNRIEGCWFGLAPDGTPAPNGAPTLEIVGDRATLGGAATAARNLVAESTPASAIEWLGADGRVENNLFGVAPSGLVAITGGSRLLLKGPRAEVSGNTFAGATLPSGPIPPAAVAVIADAARLVDNSIGTSRSGGVALPNAVGVLLAGGGGHEVLGPAPIAHSAVAVSDVTLGDGVRGARIAAPLLDNGVGVRLLNPQTEGIVVVGPVHGAVPSARAIDLGEAGADPNDPLDADAGPNRLQNAPTLDSIACNGSACSLTGHVDTEPGALVRVRLCLAPAATPDAAPGQCVEPLDDGIIEGTTDGAGRLAFQLVLPLPGEPVLAATAGIVVAGVESTGEFGATRRVDRLLEDGFE